MRRFLFFVLFFIVSCQSQLEKTTPKTKEISEPQKVLLNRHEKGMANPLMLSDAGGADIGRLFNAYYRTGQTEKMITLLDARTKKVNSNEKLQQMLSNLQFGYDMKLTGATNKGENFVLTYTCQISQTKVVKNLHVTIENDTARIVPKNLLNGEIFE